MNAFEFKEIAIAGAYLIKGRNSIDRRGSFWKDFEENEFLYNNLRFHCTEAFSSISRKNVIRGLHFQTKSPQAKLVSVAYGSIFDVVVDLRKESKTFGEWFGQELSDDNHYSLYIPKGCAHGFLTLLDNSITNYKCDGEYSIGTDSGIIYNDKDINIEWPIKNMHECILNERDKKLMTFQEFLRRYQGF